MAKETYRFSLHFFYLSVVIKHIMWIDIRIFIMSVTFETDRPTVDVRTTPQEFGGPFMSWSAMNLVAGQTFHLTIIERKEDI